jgi:hypothetical protein
MYIHGIYRHLIKENLPQNKKWKHHRCGWRSEKAMDSKSDGPRFEYRPVQ